jgi:isopenicillin-N epimerase
MGHPVVQIDQRRVTGTKPLREHFLLQPNVFYLNHGSFGACPRDVFEAYQKWQLDLERQPTEFLGRRFTELMREARTVLADYVGAHSDDLVYITNVTVGLNTVARSLRLAPDDEVLSTDHEYGALDRTWRFICQKRGTRYVRQPVDLPVTDAEQIVEAIWAGVNSRTRVLFLSHITSPTAIIFPVAELIRRAREMGILTIVDGAHAPGQIPLDLDSLGADVYLANAHKWMLSPKGAAFIHARREVQELLEPLVVSWGWEAESPGPSRFVDHHEWQGTRDIAPFLAVPAAIRFMAQHDWPQVQRRCHELVRSARQAVAELTGLEPITPDGPEWFAQMASLPLPRCDPRLLQQELLDRYGVEIPIITWNERQFARISVQGYNTRADVDALVAALNVLLHQ